MSLSSLVSTECTLRGRLYSVESIPVKAAADTLDLPSVFSDLIRLETEIWNLVEARLRRDHDLPLTWFEPMQVIDLTPSCRVIDISKALSITVGGASKLVDRIESAGLCERKPNPGDGRSSTIRLTRSGRRMLTAALRTFSDEVGIWLGEPLSGSELKRFADTVSRLRTHVQQRAAPG